jgi:hypothetical protein
MTDNQELDPVVTAERLEKATRDLVRSTLEILRPSDINAVLGNLGSAQGMLAQAYEQLAAWHARVVQGIHHAGEVEPDGSGSPAWVRAEFALHEAAHYSANAADALGRARSANGVARWFDEIKVDEQ